MATGPAGVFKRRSLVVITGLVGLTEFPDEKMNGLSLGAKKWP